LRKKGDVLEIVTENKTARKARNVGQARKARNVGQARQETYTVLDKLIIIL